MQDHKVQSYLQHCAERSTVSQENILQQLLQNYAKKFPYAR